MHGSGVLTLANGAVFEGKWEQGKLDGSLKLRLPLGSKDGTEKFNVNISGNTLEFSELKGARSGGGPPSTLLPSPLPYLSLPMSWIGQPQEPQ